MCGIVGQINIKEPIDRKYFSTMCEVLAHRGPDGKGQKWLEDDKVALGHQRLSIIDLSDDAAQPMTNEDASIWITYNGEIYNYKELRHELESAGHLFKSHSDTEVIIHAYEEWETDCLKRLRGIFSFGIWDHYQKDFIPGSRSFRC